MRLSQFFLLSKSASSRILSQSLLCLALLSLPAHSEILSNSNWQIHGFASQAFLKSTGNNFYGDSKEGSTELMETGLNARWQFDSRLYVTGQFFSRDAGATDNGDVNVDFLFIDYKLIEKLDSGFGLRLGRIKNNYGLYNDTRDVVFSRPSILMPQAVYFEGNGLREVLFSSDGLELYSHWDDDRSHTGLTISLGNDKELSTETLRNLVGSSAYNYTQKELQHPVFARLIHSLNGGNTRFAFSSFHTSLTISDPTIEILPDTQGSVFSAQKHFQNWSFTGEYSIFNLRTTTSFTNTSEMRFNSYYVQPQYRVNNKLSLHTRYERSHSDESSDDSAAEHYMVGLRWQPNNNWLVCADVYKINGTLGIPALDNPQGRQDDTKLFSVMLAWRF